MHLFWHLLRLTTARRAEHGSAAPAKLAASIALLPNGSIVTCTDPDLLVAAHPDALLL